MGDGSGLVWYTCMHSDGFREFWALGLGWREGGCRHIVLEMYNWFWAWWIPPWSTYCADGYTIDAIAELNFRKDLFCYLLGIARM